MNDSRYSSNPGVHPVGIGEVLRRIIGQSLMMVLKDDITRAAGISQSQLSAGQPSGYEAAIHVLHQVCASMETDAVLLVDADNALTGSTERWLCTTFTTPAHH